MIVASSNRIRTPRPLPAPMHQPTVAEQLAVLRFLQAKDGGR